MSEKIKIDYLPEIDYSITPQNVIGATNNTTLRTIATHSDSNCKYVRKFGLDLAAADITNAVINIPRSAGGNAWTFDFQGWNGSAWVSMGGVKDTGGASAAFVDGAEFAATTVKIVITPDAGDTISITDGDTITLTVDGNTITVMLSGETMTAAFTLYLSATGSTYYDAELMHGGKRHTPDGTAALPYFNITAALAALGGAFTIVTVLDSQTYDEVLTISGAYTLQAALGETPTITAGVGVRATREVEHDGNNSDTAYVSKAGSDSNAGTWQEPYLTIGAAITGIGARGYINVKDTATYSAALLITAAITLEPIYGIIPTIRVGTASNYVVRFEEDASIHGFIIDANNLSPVGIGIQFDAYAGTIKDNEIKNTITGAAVHTIGYPYGGIIFNPDLSGWNFEPKQHFLGNILRNKIFAHAASGIALYLTGNGNTSGVIDKNIIYNCVTNVAVSYCGGIMIFADTVSHLADTMDINTIVTNNIIYSCGNATSTYIASIIFYGSYSQNLIGSISNNTIFDSKSIGWYHGGNPATGIYENNIIFNSTGDGLYRPAGSITVVNTIYDTNNGFTIGAGCDTANPQFMQSTAPYNLGLNSGSPAHKTGATEKDMGAIFASMLIASSDAVVNGFIFGGQTQYNSAIYKEGATDYSGLVVKWCTIENYIGIAIDDYSGSDTTSQFLNCIVTLNGNGINFKRGGNSVLNCIIKSNTLYGIYCDYDDNEINHCIIYANATGLYLAVHVVVISIINSIFALNTTYGINSINDMAILNCCITDAYADTIDISDASNFTTNPLFLSETDFNIKTREAGYSIQSPCYEAADDGSDVGAFVVDRAVVDNFLDSYTFTYNPRQLQFSNIGKGEYTFENVRGDISVFAKSLRRQFYLQYGSAQFSNATDRKMMEFLTTLVKTRENELTSTQTIMRLHLKPTTFIANGTITAVNTVTKKITDSTKTWIPNEHRGFYASVKYTDGTGCVVSASAKTATVSGAGWTVNQWTGYFYYLGGYYYYIKSNTATVLTLSDKYGKLVDGTYNYSIEKYFKIIANGKDYLTLEDDTDELTASAAKYYIDFICVKTVKPQHKFKQSMYDYDREANKTGYECLLEEF